MKCCRTCKFYWGEWGSSCMHPELTGFDPVQGVTHPIPQEAVKVCELQKWEPKPKPFSWLWKR